MLRPYRVVLPNGHETILLLTELHQKRDFPDAVLVDEESPAQDQPKDQADASEGAQESEAAAEPTTQDEKPKTTRRTRKSS